jgi:iron complex outermembrane recepter protein
MRQKHIQRFGFILSLAWAASVWGQATTQPAPGPDDLTSLSIDELMNLTVSSVAKHSQPLADAPAAVTVITQEDIQRSGLNSIPELLRLVPGMDVEQIDANEWAISSRGFASIFGNKLLVLFDGRTVYHPGFAGVYWDAQDYMLEDLDRIEAIRGPGATMWGANAVNGVVNIITKPADQTQGILLDTRIATDDQNASVRYGGKIDDVTFYRVYGKFDDTHDFTTAGGDSASDGWQSANGGFRIDRYGTPQDTITLEGDGLSDRIGQTNVANNLSAPYTSYIPTEVNATGADVLTRWTHVTDPNSDMSLQLYYDRYTRNELVSDVLVDTYDLDFRDRFPIGPSQEITWGGGARLLLDTDAGTDNGLTFEPASRVDNVFNEYAQDDLTLAPGRLHLIAGSKFEEGDVAHFEIQPSARLLWTPSDRQTVWGAISRAVRTPAIFDQNGSVDVASFPTPGGLPALVEVEGQPGRKSEELAAYELGYRVKATDTLSWDLAGYDNHYDRLEVLAPQPAEFDPAPAPHLVIPEVFENAAGGSVYGLELAADWSVRDNWRLEASYSLSQAHLHSSVGSVSGTPTIGADPANQAQIHSYLDVTTHLQFNVSAYYVERLTVDETPSYIRLDMAIAWQPIDKLNVSVGVQNLLDNHHPEVLQSGNYTAATEIPRSYFMQLTWRY